MANIFPTPPLTDEEKRLQDIESVFIAEGTPLPEDLKGGIIKRFGTWMVTMWKYFFTALELDRDDNQNAKSTGVAVPNKWANLQNWFKLFGTGFIILICSGFLIWQFIKPKKRHSYSYPGRSHHGYNRDGRRY